MPRPKTITLDVADATADFFANDATGTSVTLANNDTSDGLAHQVNITSAANISAITFTLTGIDPDGYTITEDVTGPNATTVESTKYFKRLDSVAISATLGANTVDIGFVDEVASKTYPLNWRSSEVAMHFDVTGTLDYTLQQVYENFQQSVYTGQSTLSWVNSEDTTVVNATTSQISSFDVMPTGIRVLLNSYSSGAKLDIHIVQSDS